MKALVVGQGSIGKRHKAVLQSMGLTVGTVSAHLPLSKTNFANMTSAVKNWQPHYVVVANDTAAHFDSVKSLSAIGFKGKLLIEKPIFSSVNCNLDPSSFESLAVGYHLRQHPYIQMLRDEISEERLCSVNLYVGQNLKSWRTERPYTESYSASSTRGGGVLNDLSHELDLCLWLFGPWRRAVCHLGRRSNLKIDCDDSAQIVLEMESGVSVVIDLNYIDHISQRWMLVNGDRNSWHLDFRAGSFRREGYAGSKNKSVRLGSNELYEKLHTKALTRADQTLCDYRSALESLKLIDSLTRSSQERKWVGA